MNRETSMPSGSATTEPNRPFEIPGRLINHLRLFTDLDIRVYLTILSLLRPETVGRIDIDILAAKLSVTKLQVQRSLLRLMAFGVVGVKSLDTEHKIKRLELLPDRMSLPNQRPGSDQSSVRIAEALGDPNNPQLYLLIAHTVPAETIRLALEETLAVPVDRIRKSRAALFIHLIRKYAKPTDSSLGN